MTNPPSRVRHFRSCMVAPTRHRRPCVYAKHARRIGQNLPLICPLQAQAQLFRLRFAVTLPQPLLPRTALASYRTAAAGAIARDVTPSRAHPPPHAQPNRARSNPNRCPLSWGQISHPHTKPCPSLPRQLRHWQASTLHRHKRHRHELRRHEHCRFGTIESAGEAEGRRRARPERRPSLITVANARPRERSHRTPRAGSGVYKTPRAGSVVYRTPRAGSVVYRRHSRRRQRRARA